MYATIFYPQPFSLDICHSCGEQPARTNRPTHDRGVRLEESGGSLKIQLTAIFWYHGLTYSMVHDWLRV
jgi:hypothetical protein